MQSGRENRYFRMLPIAVAIGLIPLLLRVIEFSNDDLIQYPWFNEGDRISYDVFLACKAYALQVLLAVMIVMLIGRVFISGVKPIWDRSFWLLVIYTGLAAVSSLASSHRKLAFFGSYERFESVLVIVSYTVLFYYSYCTVRCEEDIKVLIRMITPFIAIMILLGILQSFSLDPLEMNIIKRLYVPIKWHDRLDSITLLRERGLAYMTLYNENYVGMYLGLLIPVMISLVFALHRKSHKLVAAMSVLISLFILYHAGSSSGWIALLAVALIAFFLLTISYLRKADRKTAVFVSLGIALFIIAGGVISYVFPSVASRLHAHIYGTNGRPDKVVDIETGDEEVVFYLFDGNELHCVFDFDMGGHVVPQFRDKEGMPLTAYEYDGVYELEECFEYADAAVCAQEVDGALAAVFIIDEHQWPIVRGEDGAYFYLSPLLKPVRIGKVNCAGLFRDSFLSGRGAIWDRLIPILGDYIFLGVGSNAFITSFPQDDYVYQNYNLGWGSYEYNVKAHSLYLNNMLENGCVGTICLILFFLIYAAEGIRVYCRFFSGRNVHLSSGKRYDRMYCFGFGTFIGCITFMVAALANDSNVCVSPVFWSMLGISYSAINSIKSMQNH